MERATERVISSGEYQIQPSRRRGSRDADVGRLSHELVEQYTKMVGLQLSRGNFNAASAIIQRAEEAAMEQADRGLDLDTPLTETVLDLLTINKLESAGICTIGDVLQSNQEKLQAIPYLGSARVAQIIRIASGWAKEIDRRQAGCAK